MWLKLKIDKVQSNFIVQRPKTNELLLNNMDILEMADHSFMHSRLITQFIS